MSKPDHIAIIGSGLAGSLLAFMLKKEGISISVFEKRIDPRYSRIPEGKSINLALSHRGIRALQAAGVYEQVMDQLIPMNGRMIHDIKGNLVMQAYGKEGQCINSISRNELNKILIHQAANEGVEFHFGYKCERVDLEKTELTCFYNNKYETFKPNAIIGTDGAFSAVRKAMQSKDRFNYEQQYISHGYKELTMPPKNGEFAMEPNYLHIWPRGDFMLIALPNPDKTFTCTLFLAFEGEPAFEKLTDRKYTEDFFSKYFKDALELIPDLTDQISSNPTASLVTIRCRPWHYRHSILIGDAAHAIVPFYGQGMNAAFEDCRLFMELGKELNFDWSTLIREFSISRKIDADAISQLALSNFIEMRDQVADQNFLERKRSDARLHELYGENWVPMYSMVTFSDTPYSKALIKGEKQEAILVEAQKKGYLEDYERILKALD